MTRVKNISKLLSDAQDAYYAGKPIMSDEEYDSLADELAQIDPNNPVLKNVGAAAPTDSKLQKVKHKIPMGSQKKVNTQEEFVKWAIKTGAQRFLFQEKLDGLSVELVYKEGKLLNAITRGDGFEGEDVTHNVEIMGNVYTKLLYFSGSLRGEIVLPKSSFEKYAKPEGKYANPRNTAAGLTRRKTTQKLTQHLKVIYFDLDHEDKTFKYEHEKIEFITKKLHLECVETKKVKLKNAIKWYDYYQKELRAKLDHEIDGVVLKVDSTTRQELLGVVDNRPKGQIAWKFANEMRKTILEDIEWEIGLTGRITPVAVLKPKQVGGVTVTRASLHNVSYMTKLGVYPGAPVLISRRNDVIPAVEKVLKPKKVTTDYPKVCPFCHTNTQFEGEYLMCPSEYCGAKKFGDIKKWVRVTEIDNVGDAVIKLLLQKNLIDDPADLYGLRTSTISKLPGYGESSARKIVRNIGKTRKLPVVTFMAALNIPNVGKSTFSALEKQGYDTVEKMIKACATGKIVGIDGIGEITAKQAAAGIRKKKPLIEKLIRNGVSVREKIKGKLTGKSFCFTGQISIKRPVAQKLVESMGGEVKSSVSKGLTYLVQANKTSTSGKTQKASKYGTEIIDEKDFMKLVDFSFKKVREVTGG